MHVLSQQLRDCPHPRGDHRPARHQRLEGHAPERLAEACRIYHHVGGRVDVGDIVDEPGEGDGFGDSELVCQGIQLAHVGEVGIARVRPPGKDALRGREALQDRRQGADDDVLSPAMGDVADDREAGSSVHEVATRVDLPTGLASTREIDRAIDGSAVRGALTNSVPSNLD